MARDNRFLLFTYTGTTQNEAMDRDRKDSADLLSAYKALSDDEIRILVLEPGELHQPLNGRLHEVSLRQRPEFRAISYVWGDPIFDHTLYLPGRAVSITISLFEALRRFRNKKETVALWADAICINQKDDNEKSHQVAMMADIYGNAQQVIVWLGEAIESDTLAFWAVRLLWDFTQQPGLDIDDAARTGTPTHLPFDAFFTARSSTHSGDLYCPCCSETVDPCPFSLNEALAALSILWQKRWFTRLWVLQEAALSRSCEFFCGPHHVSMGELQYAAEMSQVFTPSASLVPIEPWRGMRTEDAMQAALVMKMIWGWREVKRTTHKRDFLDTLMFTTARLDTSKGCDRIYALRAMPFPRSEPSLAPDYSLPISEVWRRVAVSVLTRPDDGDISAAVMMALPSIEYRSLKARIRDTGLPTWAPDIEALDGGSFWKHHFYLHESIHNSSGGPSRQLNAVYRINEPSIMRTRGVKLCTVAFKFRYSTRFWGGYDRKHVPKDELYQEYEHELIPWYLRCLGFVCEQAYAYRDMRATFGTFLIHGRTVTKPFSPPEDDWGPTLRKWIASAIQADSSLAAVQIDIQQISQDLAPFLQDHPSDCLNDPTCKLAITTTGHVAWVHKRCKAGDFVTLFQGAPFPFVLREVEDGCFHVLGDAYVQGIMHGEAWPEQESEIREFKLV